MTAMDDYKRNLNSILSTYKPKKILELGVEDGISTELFLSHSDIRLSSVDILECKGTRAKIKAIKAEDRWDFKVGDVDKLLDTYEKDYFDMIFMDITYYDATGGMDAKESPKHEYISWLRDIKRCFDLLPTKGILVTNDYIRQSGSRSGHKRATNDFAIEYGRPFTVYPSRGGMAVFVK